MGRRSTLRVALIGYEFMGRAHSQAWRTVASFFPDVPVPQLAVLCGRDSERLRDAACTLGWASTETDWRAAVARPDVDIVDVCTPGALHAEIATAALDHGKHVICEKPLANSLAEAEVMNAAAVRAAARGVWSMVGFNYRYLPAVELARQLVATGRLGTLHHVRMTYLQDWILDPDFPMVWRLKAESAGSGALGDLGSHLVDLTHHLTGQGFTEVAATTETFVPDRSWPDGRRDTVTVDDAVAFFGRLDGGALATLEASRFSAGHKNSLRFEIGGSAGSVAFDLERLNELEVYETSDDPLVSGRRRVLVTEPQHRYAAEWWPPGHVLGWEHSFVNQVSEFLLALDKGREPRPGFGDGVRVQQVLDAVGRSAATRTWTSPGKAA
jgi:predicted dehydrogenase